MMPHWGSIAPLNFEELSGHRRYELREEMPDWAALYAMPDLMGRGGVPENKSKPMDFCFLVP